MYERQPTLATDSNTDQVVDVGQDRTGQDWRLEDMGNCLKSPTSDDISLLHESQSDRASFGDGTDPDLEPPPPYQVRDCAHNFFFVRSSCKKRFI